MKNKSICRFVSDKKKPKSFSFFFSSKVSIVAKLSSFVLQLSQIGRWILLLYSHGLFYYVCSYSTLNRSIAVLLSWFFLQYHLAIFLLGAIRPPLTLDSHKCPICLSNFPDRFHHCFFVNRCIAVCNVHCFLSFTFYASVQTLIVFQFLFVELFQSDQINRWYLFPFGEFFSWNLSLKDRGLIMLTRSALISAGCAGMMGFYVGKEFYIDRTDRSRTFSSEILKILFPIFSVVRFSK